MTNRDNIILCFRQWSAANARGNVGSTKPGSVEEACIDNILEGVNWARMPVATVIAIVDFIISQSDVRTVARMSGAANAERETLRRVLADMANDGHDVINIDTIREVA